MAQIFVYEYRGGRVPGFGPYRRGDSVTVHAGHPLHRLIQNGVGSWKLTKRMSGTVDGAAPEAASGAPKDIKRPAEPGNPSAGSQSAESGQSKAPAGDSSGLAARLDEATNKGGLVRLAESVSAEFNSRDTKIEIAEAIIAKLGGESAASNHPAVAAVLAESGQ